MTEPASILIDDPESRDLARAEIGMLPRGSVVLFERQIWRKPGLVKHAEWGDCYRACVASLLDLPLEEVPPFYRDAGGDAGVTRMPGVYGAIRAWARKRGLTPLFLTSTFALPDLLAQIEELNPGVPYILGGTSRFGTGHAVIVQHGRIIHEPTPGYGPDDGGVVAPDPSGQFEITYFAVLPSWAR